MALKFQFQFAGADFSRPSSLHRKWLRIGLLVAMAVLSGLAGWGYLYHWNHHLLPVVSQVVPAVPVRPAAPIAPQAKVPQTAQPASSPAVPTLKKVATESLMAVETYLMQAAKISPAVPAVSTVSTEPAAKPVTVAVAAPTASIAPAPVTQRPYRVHTDQERLMIAGQAAFNNVLDMAGKYPDAYGFQADDTLSNAKLGAPMSVYTITESDRANYQNGQPVKPLLKPAKQWVFPVRMGGRICCMVEVSQTGHEFIPGKGNKSLAMAWNKIQEQWPAEEGYHPLLVVNPAVPGYYFTVPELPQQNLTDTIEMFYFHPGTSPADVILASWR
jgi:hypothetical protein